MSNPGNNCYLNVCLQILPLLKITFGSSTFDLDSDVFQGLLRYYTGDISNVYDSASIKTALADETDNPMFSNDQQQDASEALYSILNKLESIGGDMTKVKFKIAFTLTCTGCDYSSFTTEHMFQFQVYITQNDIILDDAVSDTKEQLNDWSCSRCGNTGEGIQVRSIEDPPDVLIVNVQRLEYKRKGRKTFSYPTNGLAIRNKVYNLSAVVVHEGVDRHSGHYQCFVRINGKHYRCNDSLIDEISHQMFARSDAYILVYEKE